MTTEDEIRADYLRAIQAKLDTLGGLIGERAFGEIVKIGHNLAGSGGTFGYMEISRYGAALETAAIKSDIAEVKAQYGKLSAAVRDAAGAG